MAARQHVEALGWRILAVNYRCASGEVDLIAEEQAPYGTVLAFIEVKTRHGDRHGSPIEAVDARKRRRLLGAAQAFLAARSAGGEEPKCRFDVAEVTVAEGGALHVEIRPGAFEAE